MAIWNTKQSDWKHCMCSTPGAPHQSDCHVWNKTKITVTLYGWLYKLNSNADFLILTLIMPKQQPTWNGELAEEQNTMAQGTYSWEHNEQKASLQIQWEQTKKAWAKTRKWNKEKPSQDNKKEEQKQGKKQVQEKQWETTEAEKKERKGIGTGKKAKIKWAWNNPHPRPKRKEVKACGALVELYHASLRNSIKQSMKRQQSKQRSIKIVKMKETKPEW